MSLGKIVVITSGKGGVGKTTVTANLGAALAATGKRTLIIDLDMGLRNLDIAMGIEDKVVYDVADVSEGTCSFEDAVLVHDTYPNLYILPASQTKRQEDLSKENFEKMCINLKERFDYILIDCPAGIDYGFECATAPAEEVIIVTTADKFSLRDADKVAGILDIEESPKKVWLCINRFIPELASKGLTPSAIEALLTVEVRLIGMVPEDPYVLIDGYSGSLPVMDRRSKAGKAIKNIAKRLNGDEVKLSKFDKIRLFKKKYR